MRCRIKKKDKEIYFSKHLGFPICPNHWTSRYEARVYTDGRKAQGEIKKYKLKDVEVVYE